MTANELDSWLRQHFSRGKKQINRAMFAARFNEVSREQINLSTINNWLSGRAIPDWVGDVLPRIEARLSQPDNSRVFMIPLALSPAEATILERTAKKAQTSPEAFLAICARIGFEDQTRTGMTRPRFRSVRKGRKFYSWDCPGCGATIGSSKPSNDHNWLCWACWKKSGRAFG